MALHGGGHLELKKMHKGDFWGIFGIRLGRCPGIIPEKISFLQFYSRLLWFFSLMLLHYRGRSYRGSQNLPRPPRIYPPFRDLSSDPIIYPSLPEYTPLFNKCICATLPESTPPSQNRTPFQQLYATLPESIPPSQNIPLFQQLCATLPETTLPSDNTPLFYNYMPPPPPSWNISLVPFLQYFTNLPLSH